MKRTDTKQCPYCGSLKVADTKNATVSVARSTDKIPQPNEKVFECKSCGKHFVVTKDPRGRKPKKHAPINASFNEVLGAIGRSKKKTRRERKRK